MKIYSRKIIAKIERFLKIPEIIVIHGARQTGKTTIIHILIEKLQKNNLKNNIIYFDLEDFELIDLCNKGVKAIIKHLEDKGCDFNKKIYLFIDEIQYLEQPSSFLKLFYDQWKDKIKLIISGSSTFAIKSKFKESLVGRTCDFELFGLDFEEFLNFKNARYNLATRDKIIIKELKELFLEYIFYGSYPRIVMENSLEIKESLLKQIINTYIKKDIKDLAQISDISKFNRLLRVLASQSGSLVNTMELANTCNIARQTLENYLTLLESTYIIKLITPFYQNVRSELTKMPKIYFEDLGIKHILEKGSFPKTLEGADLETSIFLLFRKNFEAENIHFWQTTKKQEIDFIIETSQKLSAYEVKTSARNKDRIILSRFKTYYPQAKTGLIGFDFIDKIKMRDINFIYPWEIGML